MDQQSQGRSRTPEQAPTYRVIREPVEDEIPELIANRTKRVSALEEFEGLITSLKAAREAKGLSLADLSDLTGMDRSALSKLETGQRPNPTLETLARYAGAVNKRLVVTLVDR